MEWGGAMRVGVELAFVGGSVLIFVVALGRRRLPGRFLTHDGPGGRSRGLTCYAMPAWSYRGRRVTCPEDRRSRGSGVSAVRPISRPPIYLGAISREANRRRASPIVGDDVDDRRLPRRRRPIEGRPDFVRLLDVLTVSAEVLRHLVVPRVAEV